MTEANIHTWCFFALILTWVSEWKRPLGRPFVFAGERFLDKKGTFLRQDRREVVVVRVNRRSESIGRNKGHEKEG